MLFNYIWTRNWNNFSKLRFCRSARSSSYKNIPLISPINSNFFLKCDRFISVFLTWKVSVGFIRWYNNYQKITLMKSIILFLIKKLEKLFYDLESVPSDNLILHIFITKIRLCPVQCARQTFISFSGKIAKNHIKSIKANSMLILVIKCFRWETSTIHHI